jgi:hypothetical protein
MSWPSDSAIFERATIPVACRDLVPPADFLFAEFPAEVDDPTVTDMREVTQAEIDVFDDDPKLRDGAQGTADIL